MQLLQLHVTTSLFSQVGWDNISDVKIKSYYLELKPARKYHFLNYQKAIVTARVNFRKGLMIPQPLIKPSFSDIYDQIESLKVILVKKRINSLSFQKSFSLRLRHLQNFFALLLEASHLNLFFCHSYVDSAVNHLKL